MSESTSSAASDLNAATANLVRGVDLAHVNLTLLNNALGEAGIKVTAKVKVDERVILLADHDAKLIGDDKTKGGACDKCGGVSLLSRPHCPYCGTGDEQPTADSPAAKPAPRSRKEAAAARAAKPGKDQKAAAAAKKPGKGKAAEKEKPEKPEKPAKEKPKPLAKTGGSSITTAEVRELDQVTRRLRGLVADTMSSHWKLGRELTSVMKLGVYKYRVKDGVPVHANFGAYCATELGLSSQYARSLMSVAEAFTEQQVREIGVTKLKFIARVPEETRAELLAKAAGMPSRELEAEVQRVAPDAQRPALEHGGQEGRTDASRANLKAAKDARAAAKPTRAVAPNEATAVIVPERVELPMFARAKDLETEQPIRAKTLAANPFCVYELQNGMQLHIKWVEDDDGLMSVVEFKRAAE